MSCSNGIALVKDGGVPGGKRARNRLVETIEEAGFAVASEEKVAEDGVSFTMWLCHRSA